MQGCNEKWNGRSSKKIRRSGLYRLKRLHSGHKFIEEGDKNSMFFYYYGASIFETIADNLNYISISLQFSTMTELTTLATNSGSPLHAPGSQVPLQPFFG